MGPTPLYDALRAFAAQNPLRMHMPGHKGGAMPAAAFSPLSAIDFTELPPTGDLFAGDGPIRAAEDLWRDATGMGECLFLTGGSTQGMLSALTLACRPGDSLLLDRGCHRSVYNAMALLDLHPVFLPRPWLAEAGVTGPVCPQDVENLLNSHPNIKTVCITSPTYYGVLSDLPAIARVLHHRGGTLVVDAAHGAHLPFLGYRGMEAADIAVVSAHKTLPALGQTALLLSGRDSGLAHGDLRSAASLYGSSSPSYVLMASLDLARAWMEDEGKGAYEEAARQTAALRRRFPALREEIAPLDPTRLVLRTGDGFAVQQRLEELGVWPEMADRGHVVFIPTCADGPEAFARLSDAISQVNPPPPEDCPFPPPPPLPRPVCSPRAARFAPWETVPPAAAQGRVSAGQIAPYPPGVPIVAPGEEIGKKHLAYLSQIGYNMEKEGFRVLRL